MATWVLHVFGHEFPLAALRPYLPYLLIGQVTAVALAVKLRSWFGICLATVLPLLWIFLVDARFYGLVP